MNLEGLTRATNKLVGFPRTAAALQSRESREVVIGYLAYESVPWIVFGITFFERSPLWMRGVAVALTCFFFRLVLVPDTGQQRQNDRLNGTLPGDNGREP